jgi:hypothetical protein
MATGAARKSVQQKSGLNNFPNRVSPVDLQARPLKRRVPIGPIPARTVAEIALNMAGAT